MVKKLYIVRHGEAEQPGRGVADRNRNLTPGGYRDVTHLAQQLASQGLMLDYILSSSAQRCRETAARIAEQLRFDTTHIVYKEELYEAPVRQLLHEVNTLPADAANALICGHNPGLTYFTEYLTRAEVGTMVPGSLAIISLNTEKWETASEGLATLEAYHTPKP